MRYLSLRPFILLSLAGCIGLSACAQSNKRYTYPAEQQLVWPSSPNKPRLKYVGSFSSAQDLGISKGFFTLLAEFFVGAEEQHLIRPMAVLAPTANEIFVADPGVKGVHYFNLDAQKYKLIRQSGDQPLSSPVALALDDKGQVLVADSALSQVFRINLEAGIAEPITLQQELTQPTGLAYNQKQHKLYIVDAGRHRVEVFDQKGKLLTTFGKRGKGRAEFNFPTHIWQDSQQTLWITDSLNFRIQQFSESGQYEGQFGKIGNASGSFSRPKGVATDHFGHVYIVDALFHALQVFDRKGRLLLNLGQQGQNPGEFWLPTGIYIDENSKVYIADSYNQRIQVFQYIGDRT